MVVRVRVMVFVVVRARVFVTVFLAGQQYEYEPPELVLPEVAFNTLTPLGHRGHK